MQQDQALLRTRENQELFRRLELIDRRNLLGVAILDRELFVVRANPRFGEIAVGLRSAPEGRDRLEDFVPEVADEIEHLCRTVLDSGQPIREVDLSISRAGRRYEWLLDCYPLRNDRGESHGVYLTTRDSSYARRLEDELRRLEELGSLAGRVRAHISGATSHYEIARRLLHKDGRIRWLLARGAAVRDPAGRFVRLVGTDTGIPDGKRAEQSRREAETLLHAAWSSLDPTMAVLDAEGRILTINTSSHRWGLEHTLSSGLGPGASYLEGWQEAARRGSAEAERALLGIRSVLDGLRRSFDMEYVRPHSSGARWFLLSVTPLLGDRNGAVVVHSDITRHKLVEHELEERIRLESLVSEVAAAFVNLPSGHVDREIERALMRLATALGADTVTLMEIADGGFVMSHGYPATGSRLTRRKMAASRLPWYHAKLRGGDTVALERLPEDLPGAASREKRYASRLRLRSSLTVPVLRNGSPTHAIAVGGFQTRLLWSKEIIARVSFLGELIMRVRGRQQATADRD